MNDTERMQWVDNDEYLYREANRYPGGRWKFVRDNRGQLDAMINETLDGARQPHTGPMGRYLV